MPDLPAAEPLLLDLDNLARQAGGSVLLLTGAGYRPADAATLRADYATARADEWAEFAADCAKYLDELAKEHRIGKYTLAELEEEEQSLDRLRRWYRDLHTRDPLSLAPVTEPTDTLKHCEATFDDYAEQVYRHLGDQLDSLTRRPPER